MRKERLQVPHLPLNRATKVPAREYMESRVPVGQRSSARAVSSIRSSRSSGSSSRVSTTETVKSARSSRSACPELRYLYETYSALCDSYQSYSRKLPSQLLDQDFARQYHRMTTAFDNFSKQVAIVMSSVNPSNNVRSFLTTSPIFTAGRALMVEWVDFIERTNIIADNALSPHYNQFNECFAVIFSGMNRAQTILSTDRFRVDKPCNYLHNARRVAMQLRDITGEIFITPKSRRFEDFDLEAYKELVTDLIKHINQLFEKGLPRFAHGAGESAKSKADMISACSAILTVMEAATLFEGRITSLKNSIVSFNNELSSVHERLRLPFAVTLTVEEPAK